jgi:hypothetical protein
MNYKYSNFTPKQKRQKGKREMSNVINSPFEGGEGDVDVN